LNSWHFSFSIYYCIFWDGKEKVTQRNVRSGIDKNEKTREMFLREEKKTREIPSLIAYFSNFVSTKVD